MLAKAPPHTHTRISHLSQRLNWGRHDKHCCSVHLTQVCPQRSLNVHATQEKDDGLTKVFVLMNLVFIDLLSSFAFSLWLNRFSGQWPLQFSHYWGRRECAANANLPCVTILFIHCSVMQIREQKVSFTGVQTAAWRTTQLHNGWLQSIERVCSWSNRLHLIVITRDTFSGQMIHLSVLVLTMSYISSAKKHCVSQSPLFESEACPVVGHKHDKKHSMKGRGDVYNTCLHH